MFLVELSKVLEKNSNSTKTEIESEFSPDTVCHLLTSELIASSKRMGQTKSTLIVIFSQSHCHFSLYCLKSIESERKKKVKTNRNFTAVKMALSLS